MVYAVFGSTYAFGGLVLDLAPGITRCSNHIKQKSNNGAAIESHNLGTANEGCTLEE